MELFEDEMKDDERELFEIFFTQVDLRPTLLSSKIRTLNNNRFKQIEKAQKVSNDFMISEMIY